MQDCKEKHKENYKITQENCNSVLPKLHNYEIMVVERLILLLLNTATSIRHKSMIDYYEIGDGASIQDERDCILAYVSAVPIMFPI